MIKHAISVLAFFFVTMSVQATSHFALNAEYYASIDFTRETPIMPLGMLTIFLQALIMTFATSHLCSNNNALLFASKFKTGFVVSLGFGAFLASYIVLTSPAKYAVTDIGSWMRIEGVASLIQFTIFGALLGLIHSKFK